MSIQKKLLTGLLLLILLRVPVFAQESGQSPTMGILDCIEYAKANQTQIRSARIDEQIGEQQIREARGTGLPQVNINASYEDKLKLPLLVVPGFGGEDGGGITMGYQYNTSVSAEATQMIYDPTFGVALKAAKTTRSMYKQQTAFSEEQTAYGVAVAYYQVIVVKKQLDLLQSNLRNAEETLKQTELQFKNGLAKAVDVSRLRVNVNTLRSRIDQSTLTLQQVVSQLKYQMGMPLEQPLDIKEIEMNEEELKLASENVQAEPKNRLDYQLLETNMELQYLDQKRNSASYLPTLTAFANYAYQAQGAEFGVLPTDSNGWLDFSTASIGLRLRIPVFQGLQRDARIQQSKLKRYKIEEQISNKKETIKLEVTNAEIKYKNTLERIDSEKENVELAQSVLDITKLEFREGVSTSTDVVNAETALTEAQNTYITTLLDLYTARLELENAKGTIMDYLVINQ
ncbi:TolC family protein [Limibacter armeniacum]|uniref:TolC family protein n=1 Tax=Limibacter armeniacum TaxID=466084 RepID=UPI002FE68F4D